MTNSTESAGNAEPAHCGAMLADAVDNLSLGLIVFDDKRKVVFCNSRYRELYGLTAEQIRPGTPVSAIVRHRLSLGLKVGSEPEDYIRERESSTIVPGTTIQEFSDGRRIAQTIYPMPGGGGMWPRSDTTFSDGLWP